ncbi:MAG: SRPBCC domain-containing protein [Microscillaceae bacterium]|jgi:hypothetical protein|nr:SRPBCC domain-containing protein [Microscillaceae bacterium]
MKQYHTTIKINAPVEAVWQALTDFSAFPDWNPLVSKASGKVAEGEIIKTFIKPLNAEFSPKLIKVIENQELTWLGVRFAKFLLNGEHYYKLEKISDKQTRLLHGEYFRGWLSNFISDRLLKRMETTFVIHNQILKSRLEK